MNTFALYIIITMFQYAKPLIGWVLRTDYFIYLVHRITASYKINQKYKKQAQLRAAADRLGH